MRKLYTSFLALCLMLTMFSATAFAIEDTQDSQSAVEQNSEIAVERNTEEPISDLNEEVSALNTADEVIIEVATATEFTNAIKSAAAGTVIKLTASFTCSAAVNLNKYVIVDCNGYSITVTSNYLFANTSGKTLTLRNADFQITQYLAYGTSYGSNFTLNIESTSASGIRMASRISGYPALMEYNTGTINLKSGTISLNQLVKYNRGDIYVTDGNTKFTRGGFADTNNGYIEIQNCTNNGAIVGCTYPPYSGYKGSKTAGVVVINGGTYTMTSFTNSYSGGEGKVYITGGEFNSKYYTINNAGTVEFVLTGGKFSTTSTASNLGAIYSAANVTIPIDYTAVPSDWRNTNAKVVEIKKVEPFDVTFISEGETVSELNDVLPSQLAFPENPVSSKGANFLYWSKEGGNRPATEDDLKNLVEDATFVAVYDDTLYTATFIDGDETWTETFVTGSTIGSIKGMDRVAAGDGFYSYQSDGRYVDASSPTKLYGDVTIKATYSNVVKTYDELVSAIERKEGEIILGADIEVEDTIVIDYAKCAITSEDGFGLVRPDSFKGVLLSVEEGVTGGDDVDGVEAESSSLILKNVTVDGRKVSATSPAVYVSSDSTLIATGCTFKDNVNSAYSYRDLLGGNILIEGEANLTTCTVSGGVAYKGGGIYADAAKVTMNKCTVSNNSADYYGGGVYVDGASTIAITDSEISNNSADYYGGGMQFDDGDIVITNTKISNNSAEKRGGGISYDGNSLAISGNSEINNNTANDWDGGGIYAEADNVSINDSTSIHDNYAASDGGGIYCFVAENISINDNVRIYNNKAGEEGGGIFLYDASELSLNDNAEIYDNEAGTNGGGVACEDGSDFLQNGGIIRDNYAKENGGGVFNESDSVLKSGGIYDNLADGEGDDFFVERGSYSSYAEQPARYYGDNNSESIGTVTVYVPDGYDNPADKTVLVPYVGWFEDDEDYPYENLDSTRISEENDNIDIIEGGVRGTGGKAIWNGICLVYDDNFDGNYQYDEKAYRPGDNATVKDNMFERKGYVFVGWNTEADGKGTAYSANDTLEMGEPTVLYAQWEKVYDIPYEFVSGTEGKDLTDEILELLPATSVDNHIGDSIAALVPEVTEIHDGTGTWTFIGYDSNELTVDGNDQKFIGTWVFKADIPEGKDNPADDSKNDDAVKTSDNSNLFMNLILLIGALASVVILCAYRVVEKK